MLHHHLRDVKKKTSGKRDFYFASCSVDCNLAICADPLYSVVERRTEHTLSQDREEISENLEKALKEFAQHNTYGRMLHADEGTRVRFTIIVVLFSLLYRRNIVYQPMSR
jgi:hypothetical protein